MIVWIPAVLDVLYACVLYFCICSCSAQLSMFHMERRSRNKPIVIIINTKIGEMVGTKNIAIIFNIRGSNGLDVSHDCQYTTQLSMHTTHDSVAAKQEDTPGRLGLTESKRHYLCITFPLPKHSEVQQANVSFFPWHPKWYKL